MLKKIIILNLIILSTLATTSCSYYKKTVNAFSEPDTTRPFYVEDSTPMVELNYEAADEISSQIKSRITDDSPIKVSTFKLHRSKLKTDFALITTEQIAGRLAQNGAVIISKNNTKHKPQMITKGKQPTPCTLAGAYSVTPKLISITAAVSKDSTGEIVGSWNWTVPLNTETRSLLPLKDDDIIHPSVDTSAPVISDKKTTTSSAEQPETSFEKAILSQY